MSGFYFERIQVGLDFVEANLEDDVALSEIARAAGVSQWHFQRMFRCLTGEPLKTYIRGRRLANALERLRSTNLRVLDIALMAGFESQESFARAFKKAFGMTPTDYRRFGTRNQFVKKERLDAEMLKHIDANVSTEPTIYHQRAMTLVGCRTVFYGPDSEKNNLGQKLPALWDAFIARLGEIEAASPKTTYGVINQDADDGERLEYFAAIEVSPTDAADVPEGMAQVEVPAATYALFEHRGEAEQVDRTVSYAYATWLAQSKYRHGSGPDLEMYDERYHPTSEESVLSVALPIEAVA